MTMQPPEPWVPFTCNILTDHPHNTDRQDTKESKHTTNDTADDLIDQFPASFRVRETDELRAPRIPGPDLIALEFDVRRLHDMIHLLWFAGRPVPPRPLHVQLSLGREIVLHELMEVHLVWGAGRIFLKPLPRYLLNPEFWSQHLSCNSCRHLAPSSFYNNHIHHHHHHHPSTSQETTTSGSSPLTTPCNHPHLRSSALGFLLSYIALITHESDFQIAKTHNLIPQEITFRNWRLLVHQVLNTTTTPNSSSSNALYKQVAPRFIYGELRLNRLNLILHALNIPLLNKFFFSHHHQPHNNNTSQNQNQNQSHIPSISTFHSYGSFIRANSDWIITATAYIVVVLSAMQVGLATDRLVENRNFQDVSYGFAVFSIVMPIGAVMGLFVVSASLWGYNVFRTRRFEVRRARVLGRSWRDVI